MSCQIPELVEGTTTTNYANTNNNTFYKNIVKYLLTLLNTGKIKQDNY